MEEIKIEDNSGDKKYFTVIPNYILNHSTLYDREVYVQMKRITGERGTCWTSQKKLAKQCGVSINRLKKSLKYLIDHNWIKHIGKKEVITNGGLQEVNEYRVENLWKMNIDFYENKGVSQEDTPSSKGVSPEVVKGCHQNVKGVSPGDDKEDLFNNITIKKNQECDVCFNEFWSLYPNKVNKKKTEDKFNRLKHDLHLLIIDDIKKRVHSDQWLADGGRFVPHPTTYINGERWNDEIKKRVVKNIDISKLAKMENEKI